MPRTAIFPNTRPDDSPPHPRPKIGGFCRARDHEASPFFKIVRDYFDEFEKVYTGRYQDRYGFWRPVIRSSIDKFLKCGDLKEGFARVRCPDCKEEYFVAFSCRQKSCCPSCDQKRSLLLDEHKITDEIAGNMRSWRHSGFSVDISVRLGAGDHGGMQRLIEYIARCPFSRKCRITGPALIKAVYEVDPLKCPKCGSTMKIVAFIEEWNIIEKILRHCELWKEPAPHPPPVNSIGPPNVEYGPELDYQFTSAGSVHALTKTAFEKSHSFFKLEHEATEQLCYF